MRLPELLVDLRRAGARFSKDERRGTAALLAATVLIGMAESAVNIVYSLPQKRDLQAATVQAADVSPQLHVHHRRALQ